MERVRMAKEEMLDAQSKVRQVVDDGVAISNKLVPVSEQYQNNVMLMGVEEGRSREIRSDYVDTNKKISAADNAITAAISALDAEYSRLQSAEMSCSIHHPPIIYP
jgi:hypothetical protein